MKKLKDDHFISLPNLLTFSFPIKYFVAVLCGYAIDFSIFASLIYFDYPVYLANFAGFCVGLSVNVALIRTYVYPDNRFQFGIDFFLSALALGIMFFIGMGALWILVDLLQLNAYLSKLVTNALTFVLNYAIRTVFFRKR